jgi:hypothetical protein
MSFNTGSQLIHEAMSRARTLGPQDTNSEASRPARRITLQARAKQRRSLGNE